jgi:hypothetical protein
MDHTHAYRRFSGPDKSTVERCVICLIDKATVGACAQLRGRASCLCNDDEGTLRRPCPYGAPGELVNDCGHPLDTKVKR